MTTTPVSVVEAVERELERTKPRIRLLELEVTDADVALNRAHFSLQEARKKVMELEGFLAKNNPLEKKV